MPAHERLLHDPGRNAPLWSRLIGCSHPATYRLHQGIPSRAVQETAMKIRLISASAMIAAATLVGCASTSPGYSSGGYGSGGSYGSAARCDTCGVVTRIDHRARASNTPNA